jgi:hypothetical protein
VAIYVGECVPCIGDNTNCPSEVYVTLRECCDSSHVEVVKMNRITTTGTIFQDRNGVCWEIMGWSLTGTETWVPTIMDNGFQYSTCAECIGSSECPDYYLFSACCESGITEISFGVYTIGVVYRDEFDNCVTCISATTESPTINVIVGREFDGCDACVELTPCNYLEITNCCDGGDIQTILPNNSLLVEGAVFYDSITDTCWEVTGTSTGPLSMTLGTITFYTDCTTCITANPCNV